MQPNRHINDDEDVIHLQDYVNILLRRKKALITVFAVVLFSGYALAAQVQLAAQARSVPAAE